METTRKDLIVRRTVLIGGALFILAMTYGSGMRAQVKRIREIDEQRKTMAQDLRDAQRKLRLRLATIRQLEARRQISLALGELDKRNFGTAGDAVKAAAQLLQDAQAANSTNPDMQKVIAALQAVNPVASVNVGEERDKLQGIASQMDGAFSSYTPDFIQSSAADDTAHPIVAPTMNDIPLPPGNHIKD